MEKKFKSTKEIIEQLELPDYQTQDGIHKLKDNAAFIQIKEEIKILPEIISELKNMANNYQVLNGQYVISKNLLDVFIEHFDSKSLAS